MPTEGKLIGVLVAIIVAAGSLWGFGHSRFAAGLSAGRAELTDYKIEIERQHAADTAAAAKRYQDKVNDLAAASDRLSALQQDLDAAHEQLTRRIPYAAQAPKPVAGQPAPGLLSVDGLQFYNAALGLSLPAGSGTTGTGQPDPESSAAGTADSGVSREDILAHIRDVGFWCRSTVAQRDELLTLLHAQGGAQ